MWINPTSTEPPAPVTILPVQHVREVQSGYLTMKDTQLGSGSAESGDPTSPPCVPRNSPEGIARLYIIAKQLAEERKGTTTTSTTTTTVASVDPAAPAVPSDTRTDSDATKAQNGGELPPVVAPNGGELPPVVAPNGSDLPPVIDGPTKPPFNDTTPFNGIDVSEVMELRIVKPLCDY
ncbi:unnamed protein product [Heligmosomoides polygyrus]|uniref:Uncharacterized protein n=1 Tax=Heligmosomoides polygyrus TaxID=6339 RepID=A0A3P8AD34_HELPZ|nr:unnamed protein product [Heligmosomoides polygyrus]